MDESIKAVLVTQFVTLAGLVLWILKDWHTKRQIRLDREQDRLDRAQLAQLTIDQLESLKEASDERVKGIIKEVVKTREVAIASAKASKIALKEANGVNAKIEKLGQKLVGEKLVDEKYSPTQLPLDLE